MPIDVMTNILSESWTQLKGMHCRQEGDIYIKTGHGAAVSLFIYLQETNKSPLDVMS